MSLFLTKLLSWILVLLSFYHVAVGSIDCGNCQFGLCPDPFDLQFEARIMKEYKTGVELTALGIKCGLRPANFSLLEGCSFPQVNFVKFDICPFTNESFIDIFKKMGVTPENVNRLQVSYPLQNVVGNLSTHHLKGLNNLTNLVFYETDFKFIDEDVFNSTPKLEVFILNGNNLQTIPKKIFQPVKNLTFLSLHKDNLTSLPAEIFDNLSQLKYFYSWQNNITSLPPKFFDRTTSLVNLTLLDLNLTSLDKDIFAMNTNLLHVVLRLNKIKALPEGLLRNCSKLISLEFSDNKIETIPDNFFGSNINLKNLEFSKNKLINLSEKVFGNLSSLSVLDLSYNNLKSLPSLLFSSTKELNLLDLKYNELEELPMELFYKTPNLRFLNLSHNYLNTLPDTLFLNTAHLEILDLRRNRLTELSFNTFLGNYVSSLKEIYLSYNNLTSESIMPNYLFALNTQINLEIIDFGYNKFLEFPVQAGFYNFVNLKKLNFEGNLFKGMRLDELLELDNEAEVNLKFNEIKTVRLDRKFADRMINVYLEGNNLTCDCQLYDLVNLIKRDDAVNSRFRYFTNPVEPTDTPLAVIRILDKEKLVCQRPSYLSNQTLLQVDTVLLTCELEKSQCSSDCPCFYRKYDNTVTVNCEYKNLEYMPNVTYYPKFNYTLDLNGNNISSFNLFSYPFITNLTLSNNNIAPEDLNGNTTVLPPNLKFLDLRENNLTYLNLEFLNQINETETVVDLTENPWICDCEIKPLKNFVQEQFLRIKRFRYIECSDRENVSLIDLQDEEVCPFYLQPMVLTTIVVFLIVLMIFAVLGTVSFYRYKNRIKVWLYTHRLCLWCVTEDELDVDKQYDAFISYSHKDEDFVNNILVPELENGDPSYRLCLHYRDWMAGEFIQNQIMDSVHSSRRTLVVLSTNFIESVWGQMEFRAAHQQALEDKTNRVIVIVYGEMPPEESLDEELLHYIKLHTYLKWGNPRFWENLRYAMPHPWHFLKKKKPRVEKLELVNGHVVKENSIRV